MSMNELILINLGTDKYGVWKNDVLSVKDVVGIQKIPMSTELFSGTAGIEGNTANLLDLSACLGHKAFDRKRPGRALVMSEREIIGGFVFDSEAGRIEVSPESILPMPSCLESSEVTECAYDSGETVPVINVGLLYKRIYETRLGPCVFSFPRSAPQESTTFSGVFRVFKIEGEEFAVPDELLEPVAEEPGRIHPLPTAPPHVQGVVFIDNGVRAVIDLARYMGKDGFSESGQMILAKSDDLAFLVDEDMGKLEGKVTLMPMPLIAASDFIDHALFWKGKVVPLLNVHASLSRKPAKAFSRSYVPNSRFQDSFGKEGAMVHEFVINGQRQSVPDSEVEDVVEVKPWRKLRGIHPMMSGLVEHKGEVLPVLELSACFEKHTYVGQGSKMILMENGNFRAMVLAETVMGRKTLTVSEQTELPIKQSHPYVYGCYTHDNSVRLILNVEALTSHFDETLVGEYLDMFSKKIEPTEVLEQRAETVHKAASGASVPESYSSGVEADATETVASFGEARGDDTLAETREEKGSEPVASTPEKDMVEEPSLKDTVVEDETNVAETVVSHKETEGTKQPSEEQVDTSQEQAAADKTVAEASPDTNVSLDESSDKEEEEEEEEETPPLSGESIEPSSKSKKRNPVTYAAPVLTLLFVIFVLTFLIEQGTNRADEEVASLANKKKVREETVLTGERDAQQGAEGKALLHESGKEITIPDKEAASGSEEFPAEPVSGSEESPAEPAKPVKTAPSEPVMEDQQTLLIEVGPEDGEITMSTVDVDSSLQDAELYEVQKGDTLWHIAQRFTGDPFKYSRIAEESDIKNPDLIFPGQKVFIRYKGERTQSSEHPD
jgi:chemotaxis signal transduction protein